MSEQDWRELEAYRALGRPEELCKKQGWISVKERLPEDKKGGLAIYCFWQNPMKIHMDILCYFSAPQPHWLRESLGAVVMYWMPLPEPPKEDSNG